MAAVAFNSRFHFDAVEIAVLVLTQTASRRAEGAAFQSAVPCGIDAEPTATEMIFVVISA